MKWSSPTACFVSERNPNENEAHLYIPDDEDSLNFPGKKPNGVAEPRTKDGAKIYLPRDEVVLLKDDLLVSFNGMNSNTQVQEKLHQIGGKPVMLKHLYRYFTDICVDCWLSTVDPIDFLLSCNYTNGDVARMDEEFRRFSSLGVKEILSPHVRFIVRTLGGGTGDIGDGAECAIEGSEFIPHNLQVSELGKTVPPIFFAKRLEKFLAPRHAYLVHFGLPHGKALLENDGQLFQQFLETSEKSASEFARLCNEWSLATRGVAFSSTILHTPNLVEAFERAFHSGLLPCVQNVHTSDLDLIGCTPGGMVDLLLQHGANAIEHDQFGISGLHWAAATGNMNGARALLKFLVDAGEAEDVAELLMNAKGAKDGATPLHWACCGVENRKFGVGGHANVCRLFFQEAGEKATVELANVECYNGNTPLMFAAWSDSLNVVELLLENGADPEKKNSNGHTAAQWAAAAGSTKVSQYFRDTVGLEP